MSTAEVRTKRTNRANRTYNDDMKVSSTSFVSGNLMPARCTCDGENVSPALTIVDTPRWTQSLAVVMECEDSKRVHWLMWNILPSVKTIPEGMVPQGAVVGINDWWEASYGGPCPPPGLTHRYIFTVYALDTYLQIPGAATKKELMVVMKGHVVEEASIVGMYGRRG